MCKSVHKLVETKYNSLVLRPHLRREGLEHYRLCFLQCDWWTKNSPQKANNVNEAQGICQTSPDPLLSGYLTNYIIASPWNHLSFFGSYHQSSKQAYTHMHNAVLLVWGLLGPNVITKLPQAQEFRDLSGHIQDYVTLPFLSHSWQSLRSHQEPTDCARAGERQWWL